MPRSITKWIIWWFARWKRSAGSISVTAYALNELLRAKVWVIFCDKDRNPAGELTPLYGSYDASARVRRQINWSKGIRQAVWTEIVRQKITAQRDLLAALGLPQAELLTGYLGQLEWYDSCRDLCGVELFVLVGIKGYLDEKEQTLLFDHALGKKLQLLLLEPRQPAVSLPCERVCLLDGDLCELRLEPKP